MKAVIRMTDGYEYTLDATEAHDVNRVVEGLKTPGTGWVSMTTNSGTQTVHIQRQYITSIAVSEW